MKNFKMLPGTLVAVAALLSGLTFAAAQTDTAPLQPRQGMQAGQMAGCDFGMGKGGRSGRGMLGQIMQQADANGDRAVTQDELDTFRAGLVTGADASGDGNLSLDEFETIYAQLMRERMVDAFQALDADGDGVVTQAEMDRRFGDAVARMDRNDDGKIDRNDRPGRDCSGQGRNGGRKGNRN